MASAVTTSATSTAPRWGQLLIAAALLALWALVIGVILTPLALTRHFHVDEIQIAYNASLVGFHHLPAWRNFHALLVVPLSWIASTMETTWPTLLEMRALFAAFFLANLLLVAFSAPRVRGLAARSAVLLAFTLVEPFWRHGFEIRGDVLLLAGALALFGLTAKATRGPLRWYGLLAAGSLAAWMQLNSLKGFLVWGPGLFLLLVVARVADSRRRLVRTTVLVAGGFVLALLAGTALLASAGILRRGLLQMLWLAGAASEARHFGAARGLFELLVELPHLAALALISVLYTITRLWRPRASGDLTSATTSCWLGIQLLALVLNPQPFTYNFLHLMPFLFLSAVDGFVVLWQHWPRLRALLGIAAAMGSAMAFGASWRHDVVGRTSGSAQRAHVEAAEALTGPRDPVLDAAGLVLSRRPPGRDWMLHSLTMQSYRRGERRKFRQLLAGDPAPVLLLNYRWNWLEAEDLAFVREHYVALGRHLLVLGGRADAAEGAFTILRGGRYGIRPLRGGAPVLLDDARLPPGGIATLAPGDHRWSGSGLAWAWLGPSLTTIPQLTAELPNGDLFISD